MTGAILLAFIVWGHDGRRVAQLALLALPVLLWLAWPIRRRLAHRVRAVGVWVWTMGFVIDGVARAYLREMYQAAPDAALVLGAIANTNTREFSEYLSTQWRSIGMWVAAALSAAMLVGVLAGRGARWRAAPVAHSVSRSHPWRRRGALLLLGVLVLTVCTAYASKPWRRLHPAIFWSHWADSVQSLRLGWADQALQRERALQRATAMAPVIAVAGPATVVLVITDSVNRDNMSLYGYGRATTPALLAQKQQLGSQMQVFQNAWSVDASTLPALRNMFNFGQPAQQDPLHVLALARAAGYTTWWISNHDDVAIEQQHGRLADHVDVVNRTPGRASASLDGELLDCVQEALDAPGDRKLIVVHLMGAHPHYKLRFQEGANPFDDRVDAVEEGLVRSGRSAWTRNFRTEYDAALLYHDGVVSSLFNMTRDTGAATAPGGYRAWMYLSDHGQEVGHETDRTGHSPSTQSGYRIPAVVWNNRPSAQQSATIGSPPFRADWMAWALTDLLNIQWSGHQPARSVLSADYRWQAPALPVQVRSFER